MSTVPPEQQDEVARWLAQIEKVVGEKGWDQDPQLWLCFTRPISNGVFGEPQTQVAFSALPLPQVGLHETHLYLNQMAAELRVMPDIRKNILRMTGDGALFAIAYAGEGWEIPPVDHAAWAGRSWADHPQRDEVRSIVCVDVNAKSYSVKRRRSSDEVSIAHDGMENVRGVEGVLPTALRNLLIVFLIG